MGKVFQIGFNKCGTRSISRFFNQNGVRTAHWCEGKIALDLEAAQRGGHSPLKPWPRATVFCDMEYIDYEVHIQAFREVAYLDRCFPDARFILNTRNVDDWLASRSRHGRGLYMQKAMALLGTNSPDKVREHWYMDWNSHHKTVHDYFFDQPDKLLVFDIDCETVDTLVSFFSDQFTLDPAKWVHVGKTPRC